MRNLPAWFRKVRRNVVTLPNLPNDVKQTEVKAMLQNWIDSQLNSPKK